MEPQIKSVEEKMYHDLEDDTFREQVKEAYEFYKKEYLDKLDPSIRHDLGIMMAGYQFLQYVSAFKSVPLKYIMLYERLQNRTRPPLINQETSATEAQITGPDYVKIYYGKKNPHHY